MPQPNEFLIRRKWLGFGVCRIKIVSSDDPPRTRSRGAGLARWISQLGLASLSFTVDAKQLTGDDPAASPLVSQFLRIHRDALALEWQRQISVPDRRKGDRRTQTTRPVPVIAQDSRQRRKLVIFALVASGSIIGMATVIVSQRVTTPRNARIAFETGERQFASNDYGQAIVSFDRALGLNPGLIETYFLRGKALAASGDREHAILDFSKFIQLQPGDTRPLLERSMAYLNDRNFQAAVQDASKAIEIDPKLARAFNMRGTALREMGDARRSLADFNRAVELAPDQDNYYQRAATYQLLGEHLQAITDLDRLLEIDPGDVPGYYARARSRRAMGDAEGAKADYSYAWALEHR